LLVQRDKLDDHRTSQKESQNSSAKELQVSCVSRSARDRVGLFNTASLKAGDEFNLPTTRGGLSDRESTPLHRCFTLYLERSFLLLHCPINEPGGEEALILLNSLTSLVSLGSKTNR
jgi:hypothetical protein